MAVKQMYTTMAGTTSEVAFALFIHGRIRKKYIPQTSLMILSKYCHISSILNV